jgi:hypothetical protein
MQPAESFTVVNREVATEVLLGLAEEPPDESTPGLGPIGDATIPGDGVSSACTA